MYVISLIDQTLKTGLEVQYFVLSFPFSELFHTETISNLFLLFLYHHLNKIVSTFMQAKNFDEATYI